MFSRERIDSKKPCKLSMNTLLGLRIIVTFWKYYVSKLFTGKAKKSLSLTTNIPTDTHTVTTTDIKTNMCHIHISIVFRHLATRGYNKILRTPPPHISSSEEILPYLTRRTLAQPFIKVDAKSHPSSLCPLCNTHIHTHHQLNPHMHYIVTPGFVDRQFLALATTRTVKENDKVFIE